MTKMFRPRKMKWLALILVLASMNANAQTYICVADESVGFNKNGNKWQGTTFKEDRKFTLKREGSSWRWTQIGRPFGLSCDIKKDRNGKEEEIFGCEMSLDYLIFNKRNLRFIFSNPGGYLLPALGNDTPAMAIGKCSPL